MRYGYFTGDCNFISIKIGDNRYEFHVFDPEKLSIYDPVLKIQLTEEATKLAFFLKYWMGDSYYEVEQETIDKINELFPESSVRFIDIENNDISLTNGLVDNKNETTLIKGVSN